MIYMTNIKWPKYIHKTVCDRESLIFKKVIYCFVCQNQRFIQPCRILMIYIYDCQYLDMKVYSNYNQIEREVYKFLLIWNDD